MVETAVTDVVRSTITTDDPLATLREIVAQICQLLASFAALLSTGLDHWFEFLSCCTAGVSIVLTCNPFLSCGLEFCWSFFVCNCFLEDSLDAVAHLLVGQNHTHTKLTEVFEEGVSPSRTLALFVGSVWR